MQVRLPERPNRAAGWIDSEPLLLRPTTWRIDVSLAARTLTLDTVATRHTREVVIEPATPTPTGLFSIIGAWPSPPDAFLGSWILALTAHSKVLHEFDGGDGRIGIHGRGGSSLPRPCVQPAATAASASQTPQSTGSYTQSAQPNYPAHPFRSTRKEPR